MHVAATTQFVTAQVAKPIVLWKKIDTVASVAMNIVVQRLSSNTCAITVTAF